MKVSPVSYERGAAPAQSVEDAPGYVQNGDAHH